MPHFEDDEPIKTRHASKEYRDNWERMFGEPEPRVYYAHPIWFYNTNTERADVATIEQQFGCNALNPNTPEHDAGYNTRKAETGVGMDYFFENVLPNCIACVFRADIDGMISSGVAVEAQWFLERHIPVYEIAAGLVISITALDPIRLMSIAESRKRCGR